MTRALGFDLSSWQISYTPPFIPVVDFAIQRTSYGLIEDTCLQSMQPGILKAPVKGAFHYLSSAINWKPQADFFIGLMGGKYDFFGWDAEKGYNAPTGIFINGILPAIEYICKTTGKPGLLYTNPDMWSSWYLPIQQQLINFLARTDITVGVWIAHYWNKPNPQAQANYWTVNKLTENMPQNWKFWQYEQTNQVQQYGINAEASGLDLDVFDGSAADLATWAKQTTPVPGPAPAPVAYKAIPGYNPNVHIDPSADSQTLGYIRSGTKIQVDRIVGEYAHMLPNVPYTNGGWVYLPYIEKA